jgi:Bacteroidetes-specific putative membrane protein
MKKYSLLILIITTAFVGKAQNRITIANFPQFKQYLNPALTGNDGSSVQAFYRNQITTFDKAPQTFFLSGDVRLVDLGASADSKVQHSIGLAALKDDYGNTQNIGVNLSYSASAAITSTLNLKAGLGISYDNLKTDISDLLLGDPNDPAFDALKRNNKLTKYGLNLGVGLSSENFYVGYSASDLVKSESGNTSYYEDYYALRHSIHGGYRYAFSDKFGLVANANYLYDNVRKGIAEGHLKTVFLNTFWIGGGYRQDIGTLLNAGVRIKKLALGYTRELHSEKINNKRMGANEVYISYRFTDAFAKGQKALSIW